MQPTTLSQGYTVVIANGTNKDLTGNIKGVLAKDPGLSVKELAERLNINRQFMAGFLRALEERGEVRYRNVGPARIYFNIGVVSE